MNQNVLIAEDDKDIIELLTLYLKADGFVVYAAENGEAALEIIKTKEIAIALVDIMMPKMNGYELIQKVRQFSSIPIIVVSAKNMDTDKILGLNLGADAYISKPFNPLEVIAYIKASLRRATDFDLKPEKPESNIITIGELELDTQKFLLKKSGKIIPLTSAELKIITKMMRSPEHIFTKAQLYECINGEQYYSDDNTITVHISNIRSKVESDAANPKYIKTVRGLGYKIENK